MNPGLTFLDVFLSFLLWLPWERLLWKLWVLVEQQKAYLRDQATRASGRQCGTDARGNRQELGAPRWASAAWEKWRVLSGPECQVALWPTQRGWQPSGTGTHYVAISISCSALNFICTFRLVRTLCKQRLKNTTVHCTGRRESSFLG